jgi:hypothetical protein
MRQYSGGCYVAGTPVAVGKIAFAPKNKNARREINKENAKPVAGCPKQAQQHFPPAEVVVQLFSTMRTKKKLMRFIITPSRINDENSFRAQTVVKWLTCRSPLAYGEPSAIRVASDCSP